jgi:anti-sigma factor RsiW
VDPNGHTSQIVCDEILALHGDYLDGQLVAHEAARVQWHLSTCSSCARYDRIVRRGLQLVREIPQASVSHDFEERLQHRIYHVRDGAAIAEPRAVSGAAALAVASVIALLAWSPLLFPPSGETTVAAVAQPAQSPQPRTGSAPRPIAPAPGFADLWFPAAQLSPLAGGDAIAALASFPGPYSPLRVEPPVHGRSIRTISTEYGTVD